MADESSQGKPRKRGGRIRRGWELAKQSWRVVKGDKSLLVFPIVSVALGLVVTQLLAGLVNLVLLAPIWMQLVHLLLADLLWIVLVLLAVATLAADRRDGSASTLGAGRAGG